MSYNYINIKSLIEHPRNKEFFDDMVGSQWEQFKQSIKTSGVICPVVITQDNVLVSGSQRVKAVKELGWEEIPYERREYKDKYDIERKDWILKDLIETNLRQRGKGNLNDVKLANCIYELKRIYKIKRGNNGSTKKRNFQNRPQMTSKEFSKIIGMSERRVQQIEKLRKLIPELQQLIVRKRLNAKLGIKIAGLSADIQKLIYYRVQEGLSTKFEETDRNEIAKVINQALRKIIYKEYDEKKSMKNFKINETKNSTVAISGEADQGMLELIIKEVGQEQEDPDDITHKEIQWLLLNAGSQMGLDVWVAKNDRSKEFEGNRFQDIKNIRNELPIQFSKEAKDIIKMIDVLWLKGDAIIAAFEVENTTPIYSGLLRMSDLVTVQPNININLYIVAPDDRKSKVTKEVNRPTFSKLKLPLPKICKLVCYSRLKDKLQQFNDSLQYLKPEFIERIAESCELIRDEV